MSTLYVDNLQPNLGSQVEIPDLKPLAGSVIQIASGYSSTQFTGVTTGVWNSTFSFSISNVQAGSKLLIEMDPAGLMEHIGAVIYGVFKTSTSTEICRSVHNTSGNGGWRTAPTVAIGEDTSPDVGINYYQVRIYSTSPAWYINYGYGDTARTMWKITEIAQ